MSTNIEYTSKYSIDKATLLHLYKNMLKPRLIEEKMLVLLRQGKISKWFSGIGQEAIAVGVTMALENDEYILPMHRNLGVFTTREIPLYRLFSQWQGKMNGFTKGRDRSFHFGTQEYHLVGMISHLGPQLGIADGIALANKLKENNKVCAVFTGEGGTSEGDFHEALNVASVWSLPVLFCIENNGYGLSTPTSEQFNCKDLADRGIGYGVESYVIDGNNILEVYSKVDELAKSIRKNPRPVLLEFKTFRMRGHEEASGTKYVPEDLMNDWALKDPIDNFVAYLKSENILNSSIETEYKEEITDIHFMMQKEFVDRVISKHGNKSYGRLSVLIQLFFITEKYIDIHPADFYPPPKIYSSFMSLTPRKKILLKKNEINDFLLFSKLIFNTRRKKIKNCINLGDEALYDNIEKRAEELSIEEMIKLYRDIKNDGKFIQN